MSQDDSFHAEVTTRNNSELHQYEVLVDGRLAGFAQYHPLPGQVDFHHVEVGREFEGQGLAGVLAHFAIDDVVAAGLRVIPNCEFMSAYLTKHHANDQFIDWP
ncbi:MULTISPECIES: GNAT family N-acetyltransferase [Arthrobacter]|uniref:GNAT family N-acetyltransferase n=2 Tax=Arthrobacter TaxID=1663 RepID=A0ABU9KI96_9MICC|nr:GNAT family N-acetyltransferase [Arthrobacter sp. YJM1]MDP5226363.1 GNAT family N-acetyltransferase [Arthrobacter sp. YJM1]